MDYLSVSAEDSGLEGCKTGVFQWLCFWPTVQFCTSVVPHVVYEKRGLPPHRAVTVSSKVEERLCHTHISPLNPTHLWGSFPMPPASRSLFLLHRVMECPPSRTSSLLHAPPHGSENLQPLGKASEGIADCVPLNTNTPSQEYRGLTLKYSSSASSPRSTGPRRCISDTWTWTLRAVILSIRLAGM